MSSKGKTHADTNHSIPEPTRPEPTTNCIPRRLLALATSEDQTSEEGHENEQFKHHHWTFEAMDPRDTRALRRLFKHQNPKQNAGCGTPEDKLENKNSIGNTGLFNIGNVFSADSRKPVYAASKSASTAKKISVAFSRGSSLPMSFPTKSKRPLKPALLTQKKCDLIPKDDSDPHE